MSSTSASACGTWRHGTRRRSEPDDTVRRPAGLIPRYHASVNEAPSHDRARRPSCAAHAAALVAPAVDTAGAVRCLLGLFLFRRPTAVGAGDRRNRPPRPALA